jgi:Domain of unknown function (DUF4190)
MTLTERRCPNGHPVAVSASFCATCGAANGTPRTCANGHELGPSDGFCTKCGAAGSSWGQPAVGSAVPPPPPGYASTGPSYQAPQGVPPYVAPTGYAATGTNGLAIASLVVSLCVFLSGVNAIVGLVLGIVALKQVRTSQQDGRGLAIAGIVISAIQLVLGLVWLGIILALLAHAASSTTSSTLTAHPGLWLTA